MLELSLKEYCEKTGVEFTDEEIVILETYIELKIKDLECKMWKPYLRSDSMNKEIIDSVIDNYENKLKRSDINFKLTEFEKILMRECIEYGYDFCLKS